MNDDEQKIKQYKEMKKELSKIIEQLGKVLSEDGKLNHARVLTGVMNKMGVWIIDGKGEGDWSKDKTDPVMLALTYWYTKTYDAQEHHQIVCSFCRAVIATNDAKLEEIENKPMETDDAPSEEDDSSDEDEESEEDRSIDEIGQCEECQSFGPLATLCVQCEDNAQMYHKVSKSKIEKYFRCFMCNERLDHYGNCPDCDDTD